MKEQFHAENIDQERVRVYFQERGYEVENLTQEWRHLSGRVRRDGQELFLKLASTPAISERTQNEVVWNRFINRLDVLLPFKVPEIAEDGKMDDLSWYIAQYVKEASPLAMPPDLNNTQLLEQRLPQIALVAEAIMQLPHDINLPLDEEGGSLSLGDAMMHSVESYVQEISHNVSKSVEFIKDRLVLLEEARGMEGRSWEEIQSFCNDLDPATLGLICAGGELPLLRSTACNVLVGVMRDLLRAEV